MVGDAVPMTAATIAAKSDGVVGVGVVGVGVVVSLVLVSLLVLLLVLKNQEAVVCSGSQSPSWGPAINLSSKVKGRKWWARLHNRPLAPTCRTPQTLWGSCVLIAPMLRPWFRRYAYIAKASRTPDIVIDEP